MKFKNQNAAAAADDDDDDDETYDNIQLMHWFEVNIRICQPEKVMSLSRVD